ncbi:MAG: DMT family transporter [Bacteroidales bacterium]|jgi:drug/metabolite transporter (DMT)-like permease|nr:DMT family transporter [Bacteroidales bacterium]
MVNARKSFIYAALAILFWSTIPTAFKLSLAELGILPVLTIASVTSTLALLLIIILTGKRRLLVTSASARELGSSALLGLINPFIYYIILLRAYQLLPAQIAQPLNMIWPIVFVFLSVPFLGQKVPGRSYLALLISFAGVYIIASQGNLFSTGHADPKGVMLAAGSSVFWALYFILNTKSSQDEAVRLFYNFAAGSLYLITALAVTGSWPETISIKGFLTSVHIGLFEMGITFFLWLRALRLAPAADKISNLVYLTPFLSLIFVHFILHEPVYITTPAGLLLIITGIVIQSRKVR